MKVAESIQRVLRRKIRRLKMRMVCDMIKMEALPKNTVKYKILNLKTEILNSEKKLLKNLERKLLWMKRL